MRQYLKVKPNSNGTTHIRVDVDYQLGGMNVFTYQQEPRGYYLSVVPVTRERNMEAFTAFTGIKVLVKTVTRKSAKAEREAEAAACQYLPEAVNRILARYGLKLEGE